MKNQQTLRQPKQKRGKERVKTIMDVAKKIVTDNGVRNLSTTKISEIAEIPVGSIYQYFPDKIAILTTLIEEHFINIRTNYSAFESTYSKGDSWEEFFTTYIRLAYEDVSTSQYLTELSKAPTLHPELLPIEQNHEELISNQFADTLKKLGSKWSISRLRKLSHYVYAINSGVWDYRVKGITPSKKETLEWELASQKAVIGKCFL